MLPLQANSLQDGCDFNRLHSLHEFETNFTTTGERRESLRKSKFDDFDFFFECSSIGSSILDDASACDESVLLGDP